MKKIALFLLFLAIITVNASASDWFTVNDTLTIPIPYGHARISIKPANTTHQAVADVEMKFSSLDEKSSSRPIFKVSYINESINVDETLKVSIYTGRGGSCKNFGKTLEVPLCKQFFASITFKPDKGVKYLGIKVNGRIYKGTTIKIEEGRVYVDGKYVCNINLPAKITFTFEGRAQGWYRTVTKKVHVKITGYVIKTTVARSFENSKIIKIEGWVKEGTLKVEERTMTVNLRDRDELRISCEMQYNTHWVQITPRVYVNGSYIGKPPLIIRCRNGYAVVNGKHFKPPLTLTFKFEIYGWRRWWDVHWRYLIVVKVNKLGSGDIYYPVTHGISIHKYYSPYDDNSHYFGKVNIKIPPNSALNLNVHEELSSWTSYYPGISVVSNLLVNGKLITTLFSWHSSGYTLKARGNKRFSALYFRGNDGNWYLKLDIEGHEYVLKENGDPLTLSITSPFYYGGTSYVRVDVDGSITKYVDLGSGEFVKLKLDRGVHYVPVPTGYSSVSVVARGCSISAVDINGKCIDSCSNCEGYTLNLKDASELVIVNKDPTDVVLMFHRGAGSKSFQNALAIGKSGSTTVALIYLPLVDKRIEVKTAGTIDLTSYLKKGVNPVIITPYEPIMVKVDVQGSYVNGSCEYYVEMIKGWHTFTKTGEHTIKSVATALGLRTEDIAKVSVGNLADKPPIVRIVKPRVINGIAVANPGKVELKATADDDVAVTMIKLSVKGLLNERTVFSGSFYDSRSWTIDCKSDAILRIEKSSWYGYYLYVDGKYLGYIVKSKFKTKLSSGKHVIKISSRYIRCKVVLVENGEKDFVRCFNSKHAEVDRTIDLNGGTYTITATAMDNIGQTNTTNATLIVRKVNPPEIVKLMILEPKKWETTRNCDFAPSFKEETVIHVRAVVKQGDYPVAFVEFKSLDNLEDRESYDDACIVGHWVDVGGWCSPNKVSKPPYDTFVMIAPIWGYWHGTQIQIIEARVCDIYGFCSWKAFYTAGVEAEINRPPKVEILYPMNGSHVNGRVWIQVHAKDDKGVGSVYGYVKGKAFIDYIGYFTLSSGDRKDGIWRHYYDFSELPDGKYTLTVIGMDMRGLTDEDSITVIVGTITIPTPVIPTPTPPPISTPQVCLVNVIIKNKPKTCVIGSLTVEFEAWTKGCYLKSIRGYLDGKQIYSKDFSAKITNYESSFTIYLEGFKPSSKHVVKVVAESDTGVKGYDTEIFYICELCKINVSITGGDIFGPSCVDAKGNGYVSFSANASLCYIKKIFGYLDGREIYHVSNVNKHQFDGRFYVTLDGLSPGEHTVTVVAVSDTGLKASDSRTFEICPPPSPTPPPGGQTPNRTIPIYAYGIKTPFGTVDTKVIVFAGEYNGKMYVFGRLFTRPQAISPPGQLYYDIESYDIDTFNSCYAKVPCPIIGCIYPPEVGSYEFKVFSDGKHYTGIVKITNRPYCEYEYKVQKGLRYIIACSS